MKLSYRDANEILEAEAKTRFERLLENMKNIDDEDIKVAVNLAVSNVLMMADYLCVLLGNHEGQE